MQYMWLLNRRIHLPQLIKKSRIGTHFRVPSCKGRGGAVLRGVVSSKCFPASGPTDYPYVFAFVLPLISSFLFAMLYALCSMLSLLCRVSNDRSGDGNGNSGKRFTERTTDQVRLALHPTSFLEQAHADHHRRNPRIPRCPSPAKVVIRKSKRFSQRRRGRRFSSEGDD